MHLEDAQDRLEQLVDRVSGEDWTLADLRKEAGNKRGAHVGNLLATAEALLVGDQQDLAYRFTRAAVAAMEVLELEHGDG